MPQIAPSTQTGPERIKSRAQSSALAAPSQQFLGTTGELSALFGRLGNHTVQRLLANQLPAQRAPLLQRKLEVGAANDPTSIRRQPASNSLPAPQVGAAGGEISSGLEQRIHRAAKHGKQVPPTIRRAVEDTTGANLNHVRYHDDKQAHAISSALGAKAATHQEHIFLGAGESPHNVQLMAHELTHTVQQGAPQVQRLFGKKKKQKPTTNKEMFDTGEAPKNAFFTVTAAVKMGTETRGSDSLKSLLAGGAGHSWLDIRLGPAFPTLDALLDDDDGYLLSSALEPSTQQQLAATGRTTIGFYPDIRQGALKPSVIAKQIVSDLPGHILEPEQAHFADSERGGQTYPVTDVDRAIDLLSFIRSRRARSYNIYRYNCTDFVVDAIKQLGYSMGKTSHSLGITLPTLLYKQIYSRSELGDRSASYSPLQNKKSSKGKGYDVRHLGKKAQKKLTKQKAKAAPMLKQRAEREVWAKAISKETTPTFLSIRSGGMIRPGTEIGITGVVNTTKDGQIILQNSLEFVDLAEFERVFGYPYPAKDKPTDQANPTVDDQSMQDNQPQFQYPDLDNPGIENGGDQSQDEQEIPKDFIDDLNEMDINELMDAGQDDIAEQEAEIIYL